MKESLLEQVRKDNIKYILLQFTDINGFVKNVTIPVSELKTTLDRGKWFDGSSVEGFMRVHESDMFLVPDPKTYSVIPWIEEEMKTARLICDIYNEDGTLFEGDPRYILKKVLKEAKDMGYSFNVGPEPEFFLFEKENGVKPLAHDVGGYFDLNMDKAFHIRAQMIDSLESLGIKVEASHHEVAPGQHEIAFRHDDALKAADNVVTFKFTLKSIAEKHGLSATFMPKPLSGVSGSGMHCHQSLFDIKTGKNAFFDKSDKYLLSDTAKKFVAGQLKYIKNIIGITNPLVNSYKRLVPGYEAPVYVCWSKTNRSALIRIPRFKSDNPNAARAELRCPDPSCNPYLAFAAMLKTGLEGIKHNLKPVEPVEEDVFEFDDKKLKKFYINTLPENLREAIAVMEKSNLTKDLLGPLFYKYISSRKSEWKLYSLQVHEWERHRYLEKY